MQNLRRSGIQAASACLCIALHGQERNGYMIHEIIGDLTQSDASIICHQANFYGVMGGGVALCIWNKLLPSSSKMQYRDLCIEKGDALLGTVQYVKAVRSADSHKCIIANLFCQDDQAQEDGSLTRYDCMRICLQAVEAYARDNDFRTVAVPGYMGCGIAGGDWGKVLSIIRDVFEKSPVELSIVYWDKQN